MEMPKGLSPLYYSDYLSAKDVDKKRVEKASEMGWTDIRMVQIPMMRGGSSGSTWGGCKPYKYPWPQCEWRTNESIHSRLPYES